MQNTTDSGQNLVRSLCSCRSVIAAGALHYNTRRRRMAAGPRGFLKLRKRSKTVNHCTMGSLEQIAG